MLKSTVAIGTGLTNVFTVNIEQPGDYYWTAQLWIAHVGSPTGFTATTGFSGSTSAVGWACERYTATGALASLHSVHQVTASTVIFNVGKFNGYFRATSSGLFTLGCTRTGGTSSTIQIASNVEMYLVE